jgi:hypothetical protein
MVRIPLNLLNDVQHWKDRAEQARVQAEQITDPDAKRMMFGIAESYERLVLRAEQGRLSAGMADT